MIKFKAFSPNSEIGISKMSFSSLLAVSYPPETQLRPSWTMPIDIEDFIEEGLFQTPNFGIRV